MLVNGVLVTDRDGYAGLPAKHIAFALALVLGELARHVRGLSAEVRREVIEAARALADDG